jgi:protocatechuate 3,4-dioxygenase beta subunit
MHDRHVGDGERISCLGVLVPDHHQDQDGFYDTQYTEYENDCRGRLYTDANGRYAFRGILPVAYPIPNDVSAVA